MGAVIFPLAPGVTHPFSLEDGVAAPTLPSLPDLQAVQGVGSDAAATLQAVASAAESELAQSPPSAAAAFGPWSLFSPRRAKKRPRAVDTLQQGGVTPAAAARAQRQAAAAARRVSHPHGRGAGKGRGLHPASGEPLFVDLHPSWQARRQIRGRQRKAVRRDLAQAVAE